MRRLTNDRSGISGVALFFIILVIGILAWQFLAPFVGLPSVTELVYPTGEEVYVDLYIEDLVTQAKQQAVVEKYGLPVIYDQVYDINTVAGHTYQLEWRTNAPMGGYRMAMAWSRWNETGSIWESISADVVEIGIETLWKDTWAFNTPVEVSTTYDVEVYFYDPNGLEIPISEYEDYNIGVRKVLFWGIDQP